MKNFVIELPDHEKCVVTISVVKKIQFSKSYRVGSDLPVSESAPVCSYVAMKYSITVNGDNSDAAYCLFKSQNGEWSMDQNGKISLDDVLIVIKNIIMKKEKDLNPD